jgi:hypothetical protein
MWTHACAPNETVEAYRARYRIPADIALTPEMVALHWRVERDGRAAMLECVAVWRLEAAASAYDELRRNGSRRSTPALPPVRPP